MHERQTSRPRRRKMSLTAWLVGMLVIVSATRAAEQREFEVRETAGIRRFGYPVSCELTLDGPVAESVRFRLLHEGKPVASQFRPIGEPGKATVVAIDFDANFMPYESRRYTVEWGDRVQSSEPERGMKVDEVDGRWVITNGSSIAWTVSRDLGRLLDSVKTPKLEYIAAGQSGLYVRYRGESDEVRANSPLKHARSAIVRQGPIACALRFDTEWKRGDAEVRSSVLMEFPRSKSWVHVLWTVDDPGGVSSLEADLALQVGDGPTLVDWGTQSLVYAALGADQVAAMEARPAPVDVAERGPVWSTFRGSPGKLEPYVLAPRHAAGAPEGWAHVMDRQRCTALAVDEFGKRTRDRVEATSGGGLRLVRDFSQPNSAEPGKKTLRFWLHFVPFPPHVGAVTSPQSMQSPLEVSWGSARAKAAEADESHEAETAALRQRAVAALAQIDGQLRLAGLGAPVEVIRDKWGVPHIYAQNQDDLFFAQGFVQAQDRLWQMEIWRRTTEGRLAEIAGPSVLDRDRIARLVRYRGDMDAEWTSYSPDAKRIIEAFVRGVNAYIEHSRDNLPIEFQMTGIRPEPWTPEVCIGRMAGFIMCRNATNEILRAGLLRELGPEETARLLPTDPAQKLVIPAGLDLEGIDHRLLTPFTAATGNIRVPLDASSPATEGSNNWAIAGRLTETGKPILANDPHRPITLPSLRYVVHLHCPPKGSDRGWNVIGGTEPALPGVAIGHNERIGWGMTIVGTDQQDLYVEETHPDDPNRYRVGDEWQPMRVERESIRVRGEAKPKEVELKFTRLGPVIHEDRERHRAYALRWVGSEPGTAGYLGALALDRAENWQEFLAAAARWKLPSENLVYADVDGHIGWIAAALTPVRRGWDGLLPVPGASGKYEWVGWVPTSELPQEFDPAKGYIATANHNILPTGYARPIAYEWAAPYRFRRVDEVMSARVKAGQRFGIADSELLQHDTVSLPARELVGLLRKAVANQPEQRDLRSPARMLLDWDANLASDSAAAALYQVWQKKLADHVLLPRVPEPLRRQYANRLPVQVLIDLLRSPDNKFGNEPSEKRDQLLLRTLDEAVQELTKQFGVRSKWQWGKLHQVHFRHMLAETPATRAVFNLESLTRGGDAFTPIATGGSGFEQTTGGSFRTVLDLSNWDRSVVSGVPGQSGQPASRHYGDLLPLWAAGKYHPLPFSREAVNAAASSKLEMLPQ